MDALKRKLLAAGIRAAFDRSGTVVYDLDSLAAPDLEWLEERCRSWLGGERSERALPICQKRRPRPLPAQDALDVMDAYYRGERPLMLANEALRELGCSEYVRRAFVREAIEDARR